MNKRHHLDTGREKESPLSDGKRPLSIWWGIAASALGGLMMFAAFPPLDVSLCVWAGLIPLLVALWSGSRREGKKGAFCYALYGWVFGLCYYGGSFWWINEVSTLGFIPLSMYLALYPAIWAWLMATILRPKFESEPEYDHSFSTRMSRWREWSFRDMAVTVKAVFIGAALWVCIEWLRGWVFTGFSWNGLAVALYDRPAFSQFAEYVGVTALSFIPAMVNIWLWCVGRRLGIMMVREGKRVAPWDFFALCVVMMLLFVGGSLMMNYHLRLESKAETLPVISIQGNWSFADKRTPGMRNTMYRRMAEMTAEAIDDIETKTIEEAVRNEVSQFKPPAWVIWPESSFAYTTLMDEQTGEPSKALIQQNEQYISQEGGYFYEARRKAAVDFVLITGEDEAWLDEQYDFSKFHNVMTAFPEEFDSRIVYRKNHLVPFGEYIPLREYLPFLEKAFEFSAGGAMGPNFLPGGVLEPMPVPMRPGSERIVQIIPSVCFEDTVGRMLRKFVRNEHQVIVNVTNDNWFNESWANEHHWRNASFRCIELRRPMIRSANTGVTVAMNSVGGVIAELRDEKGSPFIQGYLYAELPLGYQCYTLYALLGDWAVLVCAVFVVGAIVARFRKRTVPVRTTAPKKA